MKTINEIKRTTNLYYDSGVIEDEGRQIFQSDEDGYIYVLNTNTKRASRYNAEGLNGKRISVEEFESKLADMLLRIAKQEAEESANTEEAKETADLYCRHPEGTDLQNPAAFNQYGCVDCSKCNVRNCVHRDCMRRNPVSVGGLGECPRLKVEKQESPKKERKARKSKDIAYTYYTDDAHTNALFTLTAKQVDFIRHLPDTCFWENGLDSCIWVDCLCDEIGGQFEGKPMTVGAMISTLCEKGLGSRGSERRDGRKCTSFVLTEMGQAVAIDLGL